MATHNRFVLSLSIILGVLAISATARPCKTLFFFTSTSYYPVDRSNPDPKTFFSVDQQNPNPNPRYLTFFISEFRRRPLPQPRDLGSFDLPVPIDLAKIGEPRAEKPQVPFEFYTSVKNSIRDRTKDIMSIVGALLFGVGCGALTAATMFLIWPLFSSNRFDLRDSDEDSDYDYDDASPKKMGYVTISATDDAVKLPPAKEVV